MGEWHPFDSLPIEILEEIFLQFLTGLPRPFSPVSTQGPLLLCRISSPLRQVALNMPSLWDNLKITQGSGPSRHRQLPTDFPKTWFERAGDHRLLSLVVTGQSLDAQDERYYEDLWEFIQSFVSRFRAIAVDDTNLCDKLLRSSLCGLPLLSFSHLEILYLRRCSRSALDELLVTRCQPPESLHRIFLRPIGEVRFFDSPITGWDHLTHLDSLSPYSHDTCLKQLRALPRLISCHIYLQSGQLPQNLGPIVALPFLRHLNLEFDVGSWIANFNSLQSLLSHIQSLSATLSSLRLNCLTRANEPQLHPHFIVPHLGKSLNKLSLIFVRVRVSDLVEIMLCCPGVSELLLQLDRVQQESIALMLTRKESDVQSLQLFPSLTHLTLFIYLGLEEQYNPKHHADMILSRRTKYPSLILNDRLHEPLNPYADLKSVVLLHRCHGRGVQPGIVSLREMMEQEVCRGLELQIFGPTDHTYPQDHRLAITPEEWIYDTEIY